MRRGLQHICNLKSLLVAYPSLFFGLWYVRYNCEEKIVLGDLRNEAGRERGCKDEYA
jgi:hypothetical protein